MPKYVGKWPTDLFAEFFLQLRVPLWLRRSVGTLIPKVYGHELWRYGYPRPDHRLWESHLVLNGQLAHFAAHGRITPKPDIDRFDGPLVWFTDGTSVQPIWWSSPPVTGPSYHSSIPRCCRPRRGFPRST